MKHLLFEGCTTGVPIQFLSYLNEVYPTVSVSLAVQQEVNPTVSA